MAEEESGGGSMKPRLKLAPRLARVSWCATCGTLILADAPSANVGTSCPDCPVGKGQVRRAIYIHAAHVASEGKRLRVMRAALKKLARLEYVDPGDAQDILDEDDRRRRGR